VPFARLEYARTELDSHWRLAQGTPDARDIYKRQLVRCSEARFDLLKQPPAFLLALHCSLSTSQPATACLDVGSVDAKSERQMLKDNIIAFSTDWLYSAVSKRSSLPDILDSLLMLSTFGSFEMSVALTLVIDALLYRLFLPLLHLFPSLDFAFSDFEPIHSDVLSSSSLFASRFLIFARPSHSDLLPFSESNPTLLFFLEAHTEALETAKKLKLSDDNAVRFFRTMRGVVKAEAEAKPIEEALFEAILDAVLFWKEMTRENARKEQ
jgi:hypothetical protein